MRSVWIAVLVTFAAGLMLIPAKVSARPHHANHRNRCKEVSKVFGRRKCSPQFAPWSPIRLRVSFGSSLRKFVTPASFVVADSGQSNVTSDGDRQTVVGSFDLRITGSLARNLYAGGELAFGAGKIASGLVQDRSLLTLRAAPVEDKSRFGTYVSYGALIGTGLNFGRYSLSTEIFAGQRSLGLGMRNSGTLDTDETAPNSSDKKRMRFDNQLIIEPRVGLRVWWTPFWSLRAWAGRNILESNALSAGISLQLHMRAFDGRQ